MRRVFGYYGGSHAFVLGAIEALLITAAFCSGIAYMGGHLELGFGSVDVRLSVTIVLTTLVVMHLTGLYLTDVLFDFQRTLPRIWLVSAAVFLLAIFTTGQLAKYGVVEIYPDRWLWTIALTAIWLLCVLASRMLLSKLIERGVVVRKIVAIGDDGVFAQLKDLSSQSHPRFTIAAQIKRGATVSDVYLDSLAARLGVGEIVVDGDSLMSLPADRKLPGVSVVDYRDFYERETGRVDLSNTRDDWAAICRSRSQGILTNFFQRTLDIVISVMAFVVAAPIMAVAAIAIKLGDGGPVLFRQERVGLNGRAFTLVKFRSMRVDAESDGAPLWAESDDPRITRAGYLIRKLRIDEFPQFWNVIKGDMSFIGPRPERPYFVRQLSEVIPYYDMRHCVRPGLTGWAQVSFRYSASFEDARIKTAYDLYYVKHRTMFLDLIILLRTVVVILWPRGVR